MSEWDTYTSDEMCMDYTWDEIAGILTAFTKVSTKESTRMYNLWEFIVRDNEIHRCADDCLFLHGLVLDYDKNLSLIDAVKEFTGFECVIYTTFNHEFGKKDRYRVVIPFTKPMPKASFDRKRKSMIDSFPGVDRASFSRSQAIFLHSGPDQQNAFAERMRGVYLDWEVFEDEEVIPYKPVEQKSAGMETELQDAYRDAVISSLRSCRGFRHMTSLSLAIILKSCGANFADYCGIVAACADPDSCIHDPATQKETWANVPNDIRIGRTKRDEYIKKHGGKPVSLKQSTVLENKIQKLKKELGHGS